MNRRVATLGALALGFLSCVFSGSASAEEPPLKVGFLMGYSGSAAMAGGEADAAIKVWMQQHGDTVAGRKVEMLRRDTTGPAPDVVRRLVQELISRDKVDLIAGLDLTPNALATAGLSTQAKMPVLIVNAATTTILDHAPYMVRFGFTTGQAVAPMALWAVKNGYTKIFAIFTDYGPGLEAGAVFKKTFIDAGGTIVGEVKPPLASPDYSAYVQRAKDAHPQAIFIFAPAQDHPVAFLKAYKDAGLAEAGVKVLATGDITDENQLAAVGDASLGMITTYHYSESHDTPFNHEFVKAFYQVAQPGWRPNFIAAVTYDVMHAIYDVVEAQKGKLDPDKTIELLKQVKFEGPRGPIKIDGNRDIVQNIYLRKVEKVDGKLQNIEFDTIQMVNDHGVPNQ